MPRLPTGKQLLALWLVTAKGYSYQEAADHMHTTIPAIRSLLRQIRRNPDFIGKLPTKDEPPEKFISYDPAMDYRVKQQF